MTHLLKAFTLLTLLISIQSVASNAESHHQTSITDLLQAYASDKQKKIITGVTIKGAVSVYGQTINNISFADLLTILKQQGLTAYQDNDYLVVIPTKSARTAPVPLVKDDERYPENLIVTNIIHVQKACAVKLIPLLRPLVPQVGHMAASFETNSMIITDTYSNTLKIQNIVNELDNNLDSKQKCKIKSK